MSTLLRILFAFILACLAAGLVQVLFVKTPAELIAISQSDRLNFLETAGMLTLVAATQTANFAAPFALIAVIFSHILEARTTTFYVATGLAIALLALAALHQIEPDNVGTILNMHAILAFTISGLVGGYVYAFIAGTSTHATSERNSPKQDRRDEPYKKQARNTNEPARAKIVTAPPPIPAENQKSAPHENNIGVNTDKHLERVAPATVQVKKAKSTGSVPATKSNHDNKPN